MMGEHCMGHRRCWFLLLELGGRPTLPPFAEVTKGEEEFWDLVVRNQKKDCESYSPLASRVSPNVGNI